MAKTTAHFTLKLNGFKYKAKMTSLKKLRLTFTLKNSAYILMFHVEHLFLFQL